MVDLSKVGGVFHIFGPSMGILIKNIGKVNYARFEFQLEAVRVFVHLPGIKFSPFIFRQQLDLF